MSENTPSNNPWEISQEGQHPQQQPNGSWGAQPQGAQPQGAWPAQPPAGSAWGAQPQGPGGAPAPQPGGRGQVMSEGKGLIGSLFDFSFRHFATPHIARIVYILATALLGLGALVWIIGGIYTMASDDGNVFLGLLMLVASPLIFLLYLALLRMSMEMYVAITRLSDDVGRLREELRERR